MIRKWLIVLTCLLWVIVAFAQVSEIQLKNISRKDGLPSNETYCIFRDSKSYLWISTDQGVVRFNGSKMEHFDLPDNVIFKIREDEKGRIWFFSHSGQLAYFSGNAIYPYKYNNAIKREAKGLLITDGRVVDDEVYISSYQFSNYRISREGIISPLPFLKIDTITDVAFTIKKIGNGFFAQRIADNHWKSRFMEVNLEAGGKVIPFKFPFNQRSFGQHAVLVRDHAFYFFNTKTIVRLSEDGTSICKQMPAEVLDIAFGNDNNIWAGLTGMGAASLNMQLEENPESHILNKLSVSSVALDNEGGTWFSTLEKGIFYMQKNALRLLKLNDSGSTPVFRICNVADTAVLFASNSGLNRLTKEGSGLIAPLKIIGSSDLLVRDSTVYIAINSSLPANLWGTGVNIRQQPAFKKALFIESSSELVNFTGGDIAYGAGYSFNKLSGTGKQAGMPFITGSFTFPKGFLFTDAGGRTWLGNMNSLYYMDSVFGMPKLWLSNNPLLNKGVTAMRQMRNGLYIIGIRFGGLAIMRGNDMLGSITEEQGLADNSVKHILIQHDSLWVTTSKGISIIKFTSFAPLTYEITNIAGDKNIYDIVIYQLEGFPDKILAATSNGIYSFDKSNLIKKTPSVIPFYISSVKTFRGDTSGISSISLPYRYNRLVVSFSAISYDKFDGVAYYYRFANADTAWQEIKTTELLLENLSPGNYDLEIKAAIPYEGRSSDVQRLKVIILKPWWQTDLSKLALALFIVSLFYIIYFSRVKKIHSTAREKFALREKMLELEHAALQAQMDPHFIFNCLTSIQQLIVLGHTAKANQYLVKFSRLMRLGLELSSDSYISIAGEKEYLEEYMSLEQLRFPDMFEYEVKLSSSLPAGIAIPKMMVQPFVENCIRHGIRELKDRKGSISVTFERDAEAIICSVADNGIGVKASMQNRQAAGSHVSYGIGLVKKRLEVFNTSGKESYYAAIKDLHDESGGPCGTLVMIYMPFKTIQDA